MNIDLSRISHEEALEGGDRVVILDYLDDPEHHHGTTISRNLFRLGPNNEVKWRVADYDPLDTSTFDNLYWKDSILFAYNMDGFEYRIDLETGAVTSGDLLK